jgi:outer membrane protein assembly factor BamE
MSFDQIPHPLRALVGALALGLGACSSLDGAGSWITPYKTEVIQGNFVSKEQVEALKPGLSRAQVREVLGTPTITSAFHADRWDYSFTLRRQGVAPQQRKLVVFFNGDVLEKFEGDPMPSEAEFVTQVDTRRKPGKAPDLQATEAQLQAAQGKAPAADAAPAVSAPPEPAAPAAPTVYPPLEPPKR